jgi:hypothetical protein
MDMIAGAAATSIQIGISGNVAMNVVSGSAN